MIPYLLVILLTVAGVCVYDVAGVRRLRGVAFWLTGACVVFLFGLRGPLGYDTVNLYVPAYAVFPTVSEYGSVGPDFYSSFAPLFKWMFIIFKTLGAPWMAVQLFISLAINFSVFWFVYRRQKRPFVCVLLYLFALGVLLNMEILRQTMAIAVFLWAYPFYEKRRWVWYYALCIVAILFHLSALVLLFVPVARLVRLDFSRRLIWYYLGAMGVLLVMYLSLSHLSGLLGDTYASKVSFYANEYDLTKHLNERYYIYQWARMGIIPAVVFLYYKTMLGRRPEYEETVCLLMLLTPGLLFLGEAFVRLCLYFLPFFLFSAGDLTGWQLSRRDHRDRLTAVLILAFIIFCYSYQQIQSAQISTEYFPYRSLMAGMPCNIPVTDGQIPT